jgi:hypothetical protein
VEKNRTKLEQNKKQLHTAKDTTDWDGEKLQGTAGRYSKKKTYHTRAFHRINTACLLRDTHLP